MSDLHLMLGVHSEDIGGHWRYFDQVWVGVCYSAKIPTLDFLKAEAAKCPLGDVFS